MQAFIQYSRQFTQPLTQVASMANLLQSGVASAERVFEVLDATEQRPDAAQPAVLDDPRGRVAFEDVSFSYDPASPLIEHLDLVVEPGQTVAIVGPTGAGKTTLVNLVMRFYELDAGRITLDGVDITDLTRDGLRSQIGMVLQDAWLFGGTIRENIAYGNPEAGEEEVLAAARATYVDRFVRSLPDGYDTVLDAEGGNISAGEKQLVTIARAFLSDPALLILDEATSSVDTRTELLVQQAMSALRQDRTSFVIAHRLSTIRDADVILVMRDGRIVEHGSHEALLAADGAYAELYAAQFAGRGGRRRHRRGPGAGNGPGPDLMQLEADCSRCAALCCVVPAFSRSSDFAIDKPAGTPCPHLAADDRCGIHAELRGRGFAGCTAYDCFGAGQQVTQVTFGGVGWRASPDVAVAVRVGLPRRAPAARVPLVPHGVAAPAALRPRPAGRGEGAARGHRARGRPAGRPSRRPRPRGDRWSRRRPAGPRERVLRVPRGRDLLRADLAGRDLRHEDLRGAGLRGAVLVGADLRGVDLGCADLLGADLRGARLHGARLGTTLFLTRTQVGGALGDEATTLPPGCPGPTTGDPPRVGRWLPGVTEAATSDSRWGGLSSRRPVSPPRCGTPSARRAAAG